MGKFSDSVRNIERNTQSTADSAASAAQSNAATSRAAQSAATGAWVGAGFQAAAAFQSARAAQAAEEQLELQRARNEQDKLHQFAMWSQTPDGVAFVAWRERAVSLAQFLRNREATWLAAWARVIGRAQAETPDAEKHRFLKQPARLKQNGLRIAAILSLVIAALYAVSFTLQIFVANVLPSREPAGGFTYEQCLAQLNDPENFLFSEADCEAISPHASMPATLFPLVFFLGIGVVFLVLRHIRQRAARVDQTVAHEAQLRIERWGFDPLAARPGYTAFTWSQSWNPDEYANQLMQLALHGHVSYPAQSQLIKLAVPKSYPPSQNYPVEVNEVLEKFQHERPSLG
ncbi:hypothetical protein [Arthrobacter sp. zg-Y877]|uniref:hypothetical protein n=1 Tax=Arthrobacter sp. zg-Y877 TaxID=3049074 RepID=UPI0025A4C275|nr:hypothetical protein [Arthrobacter sp. zg-Y877]MDM7991520.1 hypothetical protein [Arthrobacter sp. zg-Y877]